MNRMMDLIGTAALLALVALPAMAGPTVDAPEPASITLLAIGIGGAAWAKFRRRK